MHLAADLTLSAISDRGHWWQAPLLLDRDGLAGLGPVRHGPLLNGAGQPMRGSAGDAEALTRLPNGEWLIAYERQHRILRHARLDAAGRAFPAPPGLEASPANAGLEALTVLADGRLLAITERLPAGRNRAAWVMERERWTPRDYRPADGLDPTDAAGLPGGGALVLERSFSLFGGFTCRLAHLADVAGPVLQATTWLDLPEDAPAENWEGVAVTRHARGKLVALVSDDNESVFQRSLLVLYRVV